MNNKIKSRCQASIEAMMRAIVVLKAVIEGTPITVACTRINMKVDDFRAMLVKLSKLHIDNGKTINLSIDDLLTWEDAFVRDLMSSDAYALQDFSKSYTEAMQILPTSERDVIRLYYEENRSLEQIACDIGLTKQRISQIKAHALNTIRKNDVFDSFIYGADCPVVKRYRENIELLARARQERINQLEEQIRSDELKISQLADMSTLSIDEISVESLNLTTRSSNCLRNAEISTIGELIRKTPKELMNIRSMGRKSLDEIRQKLDTRYKLTLKGDNANAEI